MNIFLSEGFEGKMTVQSLKIDILLYLPMSMVKPMKRLNSTKSQFQLFPQKCILCGFFANSLLSVCWKQRKLVGSQKDRTCCLKSTFTRVFFPMKMLSRMPFTTLDSSHTAKQCFCTKLNPSFALLSTFFHGGAFTINGAQWARHNKQKPS